MDKDITIRAFNSKDRGMLRQICCDVADAGEPIENIFPDREFAGDLLTKYYTDYEPESSFVAEADGLVVGYINGCLDNRRYGLVTMFLIVPLLLLKGLWRGIYFRAEFWQIIKTMLKNWRRAFSWRKKSFHSHQGHMHIGIAKDYRHQQIGEKLARAFLDYAKTQHAQEITASVHDGNLPACRFFDRLGFKVRDRYPTIAAYGTTFKEYNALYYVKTID